MVGLDEPQDGQLKRGVPELPERVCREVGQLRVRLRCVVKPLEDPDGEDEMAKKRRDRLVLPEEF